MAPRGRDRRAPSRRSAPTAIGLGVLAAVVAGCGLELEDDAPTPTTTTVAGTAASGEDAPPIVVGLPTILEELDAGDCFNRYRWTEDGRRIDVTAEIPCDQPHDGEVYAVSEYPAPFGTPYPGDDAMLRYARGTCYDAFAAFAGIQYELSELEIGVVTPKQQNFEDEAARYRGITCYVELPGAQLVGSSRGRAR